MTLGSLKPVRELGLRKPHGTRLRYMAGCKCMLCRAANSRYETERAALRKAGFSNGIVSARFARKWIDALGRKGIGYKTVAKNAGVSKTIVWKIKTGKRQRIRAMTQRRILELGGASKPLSLLVPARATWRSIEWLMDEGFSKGEIASRLGRKTRALQINKERITVRTASAVERLYLSFQ